METYRDPDIKETPKRWSFRRSFILGAGFVLASALIGDGVLYKKAYRPDACTDIIYVLGSSEKISCPPNTRAEINGWGTNAIYGRCICK